MANIVQIRGRGKTLRRIQLTSPAEIAAAKKIGLAIFYLTTDKAAYVAQGDTSWMTLVLPAVRISIEARVGEIQKLFTN